MKKNILFIVNSGDIVERVRNILEEKEFTIFQTDNSSEAIKTLQLNRIDLLVLDLGTEEEEGIQFLKKVKKAFPMVVRIILSETKDEELAFKCIQNNLCKLYFLKPIEHEKLTSTIDHILNVQDILTSKELLFTINSIDSLPTLPEIYMKMNQALDDEAGVDEISDIIESDPGVSLQVLKVANSAFFGTKTGSVKNAILNLGLINVKNIVLTTGIVDFLNIKGFQKELFWKHALLTNRILMHLYKHILNKSISSMYASAGILHDIGRFVLFKNYPKNYEEVFNIVLQRQRPFVQVEKEILNISHEEVGAYLLNWWDIPNPIVEAALFHETPELSSEVNKELVCMVNIADFYAWKVLKPVINAKISDYAFEYLKTSQEDLDEVVNILRIDV